MLVEGLVSKGVNGIALERTGQPYQRHRLLRSALSPCTIRVRQRQPVHLPDEDGELDDHDGVFVGAARLA